MNLQESIRTILREENNELESRKTTWLVSMYDKVFDDLNLVVKTDDGGYIYGKWRDKEKNVIFSRNHWGVFWINDCKTYKILRFYSKFLYLSFNKFENILIEYVNDRYGDKFFGRPIKAVKDEYFCLENDDQDGINESNSKKDIGKKLKGSGTRIMREETELPIYFRRRIDMEIIEQLYRYVLKIASKRYTDKKKHLNAMTPYKFNHIVISNLIEEVSESFELIWDDDGERFNQLWDFLNGQYSERNIEHFYKIR